MSIHNNLLDEDRAMYHIRELLKLFGDNPEREGLQETPKRAVKMFKEVLAGMDLSNLDIADMNNKCFEEEDITEEYSGMVLVKDIPIFSFCEHHLALMYNMKVTVAYLPKSKVIGLSKIARIAELVGKRLQLQERIGKDIADILEMVTGSSDIAVIIEGEHACMTSRGIKKPGAVTRTSTLRGRFMTEAELRNELMLLAK